MLLMTIGAGIMLLALALAIGAGILECIEEARSFRKSL